MRHLEEAILGGILMSRAGRERYLEVRDIVGPQDFVSDRCRKGWEALGEVFESGQPLSWVTYANRLAEEDGDHEAAKRWINDITLDLNIIPDYVAQHARVLRVETGRRKIQSATHEINEAAKVETISGIANEARKLADLTSDVAAEYENRSEILDDVQLVEKYHEHITSGDQGAVQSGWYAIDKNGGLLPGELVTIVARPKVGKSALAQNLCCNVLLDHPERSALYFTLEMPVPLFEERWKQITCGQRRSWVRAHYLDEAIIDRMKRFGRLKVSRPSKASLADLRRDMELVKRQLGHLNLVVIDHADFVDLPNPEQGLADRIRGLYVGLKRAAGDIGATLVVLHQGSRQQGEGTDEPTASSARGSAAPEEVSDLLLGAWRPGMDKGEGRTLKLKAIVARRMPTFFADLEFDPETLVIRDTGGGSGGDER